jgi:hypothetical protein
MSKNKEFYLLLLGKLLREIRNLEDSQLIHAKNLAYIFHDVPALLLNDFESLDPDQAFEMIRARSEPIGYTQTVNAFEEYVTEIMRSRHDKSNPAPSEGPSNQS